MVLKLPAAGIVQFTEINTVGIFGRGVDNMGFRSIRMLLLAHDEHRIGIRVRLRLGDVLRREHLLVEVEADKIVFVGKTLQKGLGRVALDSNGNGTAELLTHLFDKVVLKTDDRAVIDKIVGGVVENKGGDGVAVHHSYLLHLLEFVFKRQIIDTFVGEDEDT